MSDHIHIRGSGSSALNAARRKAEWEALKATAADPTAKRVDLVVIGAGITGAGIALDAASRGLTTVLVEAHDLAFGTSRWSSKLAHGGLRYLATGNVGIAQRSAAERRVLMEKTAPHLVHALAQVVPVYSSTKPVNAVLPRLGFIAGDALRVASKTSSATLPRSRTISSRAVVDFAPAVKIDSLKFGHLNYDGQLLDDSRLVTAVARTAATFGAKILTKVRASDASGTSVTLTDQLTGDSFTLNASSVVNATGVWAGEVSPDIHIRPSRGTHIVVKTERLGNSSASLTVPVPGHTNRFCFTLPAPHGRTYIGLTDEDNPGPIPDVPEVPEDDVDFLLDVINQALEQPLTRDDVIGAFAGLRPLIDLSGNSSDGADDGNDNAEKSTADLSRNHAILTAPNGLISTTGGKLTEYRLMAEQTVDLVVKNRGMSDVKCHTKAIPLVGSPEFVQVGSDAVTHSTAVDIPTTVRLRFGAEAPDVIASCPLDNPTAPVADGIDICRAEFAWHVTHEGALTVDDIVDRRSRIGLVAADREAVLPAAAEAIALLDDM